MVRSAIHDVMYGHSQPNANVASATGRDETSSAVIHTAAQRAHLHPRGSSTPSHVDILEDLWKSSAPTPRKKNSIEKKANALTVPPHGKGDVSVTKRSDGDEADVTPHRPHDSRSSAAVGVVDASSACGGRRSAVTAMRMQHTHTATRKREREGGRREGERKPTERRPLPITTQRKPNEGKRASSSSSSSSSSTSSSSSSSSSDSNSDSGSDSESDSDSDRTSSRSNSDSSSDTSSNTSSNSSDDSSSDSSSDSNESDSESDNSSSSSSESESGSEKARDSGKLPSAEAKGDVMDQTRVVRFGMTSYGVVAM